MKTGTPLVLLLLAGCERSPGGHEGSPLKSTWDAALRVEAASVDGTVLASSSTLTVTFSAYESASVDHYRAAISGTGSFAASQSPLTITGLRSDTPYDVTVTACLDADCTEGATVTGEGRTELETWRLGGDGEAIEGVSALVPEGAVQAQALTLGSWSGVEEGRVQLYYAPLGDAEPYGIRVATTPDVPTDFASASSFATLEQTGLLGGAPQAVPITVGEDVRMRLFMEVAQPEMAVEIGYLDSQDELGRDFHPGESAPCCEPSFIDVVGGQFNVVYPTASTSLWDQAAGTPMFVTMHEEVRGCSDYFVNAAYVVWDGEQWNVEEEDGCPVLFPNIQAPSPLHLGGAKYKLYFHQNEVSQPADGVGHRPFRVIYGDASLTGDPAVLDASDWEASDEGRDILVEWPNGTSFPDDHESLLDDYSHILPTGDVALQVMYSNISTPDAPEPFLGALRLVNP